MNLREAQTFFDYNRWANRRLLDAAEALSSEELERDLGGSFASFAGTLRHLFWGERSWLGFWRDGSFGPPLAPDALPDLASIEAAWMRLEEEKDVFLHGLTDEKLGEPRRVDEDEYVLGELLQHCFNHSTHHRGQVVHMLRQLGRMPPGTGFRSFLTQGRRAS